MKLLSILFFLLVTISSSAQVNILVFSKTEGFRHSSIEDGTKALHDIASSQGWVLTHTENERIFNPQSLFLFDVIVFLNTSGDFLDDGQKQAFKDYIHQGGGYVGIHAASNTEMQWKWYTDMVGAIFEDHPKRQDALVKTIPEDHPSTMNFPKEQKLFDEWYNFKEPVASYVTPLLEVDEASYEGGTMNNNHPISWYHYYEGGRIFYTVLGHTSEMYSNYYFIKHITGAIQWAAGLQSTKLSDQWSAILKNDLSHWNTFIGVPHKEVGIKGYENSDGKKGEPLGWNNDPKRVFEIIEMDAEKVLKVSGELYGAIVSRERFGNYHLRLQFKWGKKKYAPRKDKLRDSGILYHSFGPQKGLWNVWAAAQEFQVQEGDCGDYYAVGGVSSLIPAKKGDKNWIYDPKEPKRFFSSAQVIPGHCKKSDEVRHEKPNGQWNTLELICYKNTSLHILNGELMMSLYDPKTIINNKAVSMCKGKLQIQSEGAEVYYKNIEIKSISAIPDQYKTLLPD